MSHSLPPENVGTSGQVCCNGQPSSNPLSDQPKSLLASDQTQCCSGQKQESSCCSGNQTLQSSLPDVASEMAPDFTGDLDRVGMSGIELATKLKLENGSEIYLPAFADAFVSLDNPNAKGIHMSRLFLQLDESCQDRPLSPALLSEICDQFLATHDGISLKAELQIKFRLPIRRKSLLSNHSGQRHYPITIGLNVDRKQSPAKKKIWVEAEITYSSTCPCSAALSRQLLQKRFQETIGKSETVNSEDVSKWLLENGSVATPHSQRSVAKVKVQLDDQSDQFPAESLIQQIETCLQTPVQAVVKRLDEQEFARLNGANLMFCEDAARKMKEVVEEFEGAIDYRIEARHLESLHPHDAVAIATKGIEGGFQP